MQKKWLLPLIGVGAMLATVAGGSVVLAQTATETPSATETPAETPLKKFSSRVAEILGIEQSKVEDAMQQAGREMADEKVEQRLQRMVEAGRLTQEQADEYLAWFRERPQDIPGFLGMGGPGHHGPRGHFHGPRGHMFGPGMKGGPTETPSTTPANLQVLFR